MTTMSPRCSQRHDNIATTAVLPLPLRTRHLHYTHAKEAHSSPTTTIELLPLTFNNIFIPDPGLSEGSGDTIWKTRTASILTTAVSILHTAHLVSMGRMTAEIEVCRNIRYFLDIPQGPFAHPFGSLAQHCMSCSAICFVFVAFIQNHPSHYP
ncbi:hypothetical protein SCLCIDRAFT_293582 [Scleroderma citrinum Foug A]|uniref:Uncharacterized protein n=1 Tax=Scleroderma citrinum Foug A TaxID=1036808 RepID=A0A0C3AP02_9AGAM|nr:hypothetical protein SCLCIDRAFT_293582 [Scleroderma citrinum Foug A]